MKRSIANALSVLLTGALLLSSLPVFTVSAAGVMASGNCGSSGDNVQWTLYDDGLLDITGTGEMVTYLSDSTSWLPLKQAITNVRIGDGITSVSYHAFEGCDNLVSVTVPATVDKVGELLFSDCISLTEITLANGLKEIGSCMFRNCSALKEITIPSSVEKIDQSAFGGCENLVDITIPYGVKEIGPGAFSRCNRLTSVTIPKSVVSLGSSAFDSCENLTSVTLPNSITGIGSRTFSGCSSLTSIVLPDSVQSIGQSAFESCESLQSVVIGKGVQEIKNRAFYQCYALTYIAVNNQNPYYTAQNGVLFNKQKTELIQYPVGKPDTAYTVPGGVQKIGNEAFFGCESLVSVTFPDGFQSIGGSCFGGCRNLADLLLPDSMQVLDVAAFSGCISLKRLLLPDNVQRVGSYAFSGCTGLTDITIGKSVQEIGYEVFSHCAGLTDITVSEENPSFCSQDGVLFNKEKTRLVQYPAGKPDTAYTVPTSVQTIGVFSFSTCVNLKSIAINNAQILESQAFYNCDSLEAVTIGDSVQSIGDSAFGLCDNLKYVTIGRGLRQIGFYVFLNCPRLTDISVGQKNLFYSSQDGVLFTREKTILIQYPVGTSAASYTVPDSVKIIDAYAFNGCQSLENVTLPDGLQMISSYAFEKCTALTTITIPDSVMDIQRTAFADSGLTTIRGHMGSYAETFADQHGIAFEVIKPYMTGDVSGDEKITVADYGLVLSHVRGVKRLSGDALGAADVNGDKSVSVADYGLILAHVRKVKPIVNKPDDGPAYPLGGSFLAKSVDDFGDDLPAGTVTGDLENGYTFQTNDWKVITSYYHAENMDLSGNTYLYYDFTVGENSGLLLRLHKWDVPASYLIGLKHNVTMSGEDRDILPAGTYRGYVSIDPYLTDLLPEDEHYAVLGITDGSVTIRALNVMTIPDSNG